MLTFDWVREAEIPLPPWSKFRFQSLREMVTLEQCPAVLARPVLIGVVNGRAAVVTLGELQQAVRMASAWCVEQRV
ncbi:MAG: hypothetical protein ACKPHU_18580, partial [Planctomycetaceae bacterium]